MSERYELKIGDADWKAVTKAAYIQAERDAGYRPKGMDRTHRKFYAVVAEKDGFSVSIGNRPISGRIVAEEDADA